MAELLGESATFLTLDPKPLVLSLSSVRLSLLHWCVSWTLFGKCESPPVHGASLIHGCWQTTVVSSWRVLSRAEWMSRRPVRVVTIAHRAVDLLLVPLPYLRVCMMQSICMLHSPTSDEEVATPTSPFPSPETPVFSESPVSPPSPFSQVSAKSPAATIWHDSDAAYTESEPPQNEEEDSRGTNWRNIS